MLALRGHIIIDPVGRVRQIAMSFFHIGPNVDELIRCVASISNEQS
jgi:alkyl hydroperoxide reductase subunit AhpC